MSEVAGLVELDVLGRAVARSVKAAVDPLLARIAAQDEQIKALFGQIKHLADQHAGDDALMARLTALEDREASGHADMTVRLDGIEQRHLLHFDGIGQRMTAIEVREQIPGPRGEQGASGHDGVDGKDGASGLQGPPGEPGQAGAPGARGEKGETGDRGEKGLQGDLGPQGRDGRDGQPGGQGAQGERGTDGNHGKDGATGKNGLDGTLEGLSVVQADERTIRFQRENGDVLGKVEIPAVLDRGVYNPEKTYEKGDAVSYAGSLFIAQRDTLVGEKPEDGLGGWRLAVKRGRDGTKGKDGKDGERGKDGKDGRIIS